MVLSPSYETREVLYPAIQTIPGHPGLEAPETPRDHYCVCDGVRDGAGLAEINNDDTNLMIISPAFNPYLSLCLSVKPFSWEPSGLIKVVE